MEFVTSEAAQNVKLPDIIIEVYLLQRGQPPYPGRMHIRYSNRNSMEVTAYQCPDCGALFPDEYPKATLVGNPEPLVQCQDCSKIFPEGALQTHLSFRWYIEHLAQELAYLVNRVGRVASVRLYRYKSKKTFRTATSLIGSTQSRDLLRFARSDKAQEWIEYSQERLGNDLASGQDMVTALKAFLTA